MIRVSLASDKELLNAKILFHAKGAIYCSFCLMLLHLLVLGSATMFLKYNGEILYHYFFAALTAAEVCILFDRFFIQCIQITLFEL